MFRLEDPLPAPPMLSDGEFAQLRRFIHQAAGIAMSPGKRSLIQSRLAKRQTTAAEQLCRVLADDCRPGQRAGAAVRDQSAVHQ